MNITKAILEYSECISPLIDRVAENLSYVTRYVKQVSNVVGAYMAVTAGREPMVEIVRDIAGKPLKPSLVYGTEVVYYIVAGSYSEESVAKMIRRVGSLLTLLLANNHICRYAESDAVKHICRYVVGVPHRYDVYISRSVEEALKCGALDMDICVDDITYVVESKTRVKAPTRPSVIIPMYGRSHVFSMSILDSIVYVTSYGKSIHITSWDNEVRVQVNCSLIRHNIPITPLIGLVLGLSSFYRDAMQWMYSKI